MSMAKKWIGIFQIFVGREDKVKWPFGACTSCGEGRKRNGGTSLVDREAVSAGRIASGRVFDFRSAWQDPECARTSPIVYQNSLGYFSTSRFYELKKAFRNINL